MIGLSLLQTLVSSEEFERTKKLVAEFGKSGGVGEQLQKKLLERSEVKESWVRELPLWWLQQIAATLQKQN